MDRRTLLKLVATSPLLSMGLPPKTSCADPASALADAARRRVRPGDPDRPGAAEWNRLKEAVGGRLINVESPTQRPAQIPTRPPAKSYCAICAVHSSSATSPGRRAGTGGADGWTSAPSVYAVAARTAADVSAAVNFAREHNLRLVVKGGGHSFHGTSNAPDLLLVWDASDGRYCTS